MINIGGLVVLNQNHSILKLLAGIFLVPGHLVQRIQIIVLDIIFIRLPSPHRAVFQCMKPALPARPVPDAVNLLSPVIGHPAPVHSHKKIGDKILVILSLPDDFKAILSSVGLVQELYLAAHVLLMVIPDIFHIEMPKDIFPLPKLGNIWTLLRCLAQYIRSQEENPLRLAHIVRNQIVDLGHLRLIFLNLFRGGNPIIRNGWKIYHNDIALQCQIFLLILITAIDALLIADVSNLLAHAQINAQTQKEAQCQNHSPINFKTLFHTLPHTSDRAAKKAHAVIQAAPLPVRRPRRFIPSCKKPAHNNIIPWTGFFEKHKFMIIT